MPWKSWAQYDFQPIQYTFITLATRKFKDLSPDVNKYLITNIKIMVFVVPSDKPLPIITSRVSSLSFDERADSDPLSRPHPLDSLKRTVRVLCSPQMLLALPFGIWAGFQHGYMVADYGLVSMCYITYRRFNAIVSQLKISLFWVIYIIQKPRYCCVGRRKLVILHALFGN